MKPCAIYLGDSLERIYFALVLAVMIAGTAAAQSNRQPQPVPQRTQEQSATDQRGTNNAPLVVQVLPTPKTAEEAQQDQTERKDESAANWWMVKLTGVIAIIGLLQAWVFWKQAGRLKETVETMERIAQGQTTDMQNSISEAGRAAAAMERAASGIETNVATTSALAKNQREFWQKQMRAYVGIIPGAVFEQDTTANAHFECQPFIQNDGLTPAYGVTHVCRTTLLPCPLPPDFDFTLGAPARTTTTLNPRTNIFMVNAADAYYSPAEYQELKTPGGRRLYTYGSITYSDMSGDLHTTNFCFFFVWGAQGKPTYIRAERHNEAN